MFEQDRGRFGGKVPEANESSQLKPFILHALSRAGTAKGDELLQAYDMMKREYPPDKDLLAPYEKFADYALNAYSKHKLQIFQEQLAHVREHVDKARTAYELACYRSREDSPEKKKKKRSKEQKDSMLLASHLFSQQVAETDLIPNIDEVKASYAYKSSPTFGFTVAFRELCLIKAKASGIAPIVRLFDEAKSLSSKYIRAVVRMDID